LLDFFSGKVAIFCWKKRSLFAEKSAAKSHLKCSVLE
jgi:hypothetical protein